MTAHVLLKNLSLGVGGADRPGQNSFRVAGFPRHSTFVADFQWG